jgi:anti-anti-sigma regulatory factor
MSAVVTATPGAADGTWLVSLHGDHDLATRPRLEQETGAIWPACKVAVIDLSDVAFMDSGVIRWLLDVERRLEEAGGFTLSIVEGRPESVADRIFQFTAHAPRPRVLPDARSCARPGTCRRGHVRLAASAPSDSVARRTSGRGRLTAGGRR